MDASWFVRPETVRLPLSDGQWIRVKQQLSAGEFRAHLKRSSRVDGAGVRRLDQLDHSLSLVVSYLVDWSLERPIAGLSEQELTDALDALDPPRFAEIKAAIDAHEAAGETAREEKKRTPTGTPASDPIGPLPLDVASGSPTSVN